VTPVDQLMVQLGIDERVRLPEDQAPATDAARKAILEFFDGFARGDAAAVGSLLSALDRRELDELVECGQWEQTTARITSIDLKAGKGPEGPAVLAVFTVGLDFQPQLWYYTVDDEGASFDAVPTPPDIVDRLSGTDWIDAWFKLLDEELAMADEPELEFKPQQRDFTMPESDTGPQMGPSGPDNSPRGPGGPGAPGKRPKKNVPKRRPPGPPGG
jgi:hypothetical protein